MHQQATLDVLTKRLGRYLRRAGRRQRRRASAPKLVDHPYNIAGGDLSQSSDESDVEDTSDSTRHRIMAMTGHYIVDSSGQVWFTHATQIITQMICVRPDPRLIVSSKIASRVAKTVRYQCRVNRPVPPLSGVVLLRVLPSLVGIMCFDWCRAACGFLRSSCEPWTLAKRCSIASSPLDCSVD